MRHSRQNALPGPSFRQYVRKMGIEGEVSVKDHARNLDLLHKGEQKRMLCASWFGTLFGRCKGVKVQYSFMD